MKLGSGGGSGGGGGGGLTIKSGTATPGSTTTGVPKGGLYAVETSSTDKTWRKLYRNDGTEAAPVFVEVVNDFKNNVSVGTLAPVNKCREF